MSFRHAAVWLDHEKAKIFHVEPEGFAVEMVLGPHEQVPADGDEPDPARPKHFFHGIAKALKDAKEILVVGPASAKLDFLRYLRKHDAALERKVLGVETLEHGSDEQLAEHIRRYFRDADSSLAAIP